jgi:UPF0271 protein
MLSVDLNCDMGEGMDNDEAIMPFVSSVNIACGYHAGNETIMRRTVEQALKHGVAIGAHPSYPDREHFGRIDRLGQEGCTYSDIPAIIKDQLHTLKAFCNVFGAPLHHVKPHGALYNRAAKDPALSAILCDTIRRFDPGLLFYGLSGSRMHVEAEHYGLRFVHEVFADRSYQEDGSLTPRTEPGALIEDPLLAVRQVLRMVKAGKVSAVTGKDIALKAQTICIHGDGFNAAGFARMIHEGLREEGILISA